MRILSKFKNVKIGVWSGGGKDYAQMVCDALDCSKYVDKFASKLSRSELQVDIAIDDIQECQMGVYNLIVREK